jgi:hypothetical protein
MELSGDNYDRNNYNLNNEYYEKINNLNAGVDILLDNFKKLYIVSKINPSNQQIQEQYQNTIHNLEEVLSQLFITSNSIQVNIDDLNQQLFKLNIFITKEREKNRKLKSKLGIIENTGNASSEMINNYKELYNMNYLRNWSLLLSSFLCIAAIGVVYKKPGV